MWLAVRMGNKESSDERGRTSMGTNVCPRDSISRVVCEPMKPFAPVINILEAIPTSGTPESDDVKECF
jgi:hypothetical protein